MNDNLNPDERNFRTAVLALLGAQAAVSQEDIQKAIDDIRLIWSTGNIDVPKVQRNIEVCVNVRITGISGTLGDDIDHVEWLGEKRPNITWGYWERYKHWLKFVIGLPPNVVDELDNTTDDVLRRLEDPARPGEWDRRGMVVGHVQSGKTAHYTGLVCKAVDAGYRLIVILAGSDNGLRAQTQLRIDEGFLGFTMGHGAGQQRGRRVGVGELHEFDNTALTPISLTTAAEEGDFKKAVAQGLGIVPGGAQPLVLVVKKNSSVLKNLTNWVSAVVGSNRDGIHKISNLPILVIDDECDFSSVNTKNTIYDFERQGVQGEPTKINGHIRRLLHMFDQSAYIGYTATPFANIFIYHEEGKERKEFGEDLFPRSFIICLARSSEYMGADRVFGLSESPLQGITERAGLPILRRFSDLEEFIPHNHDKGWRPPNVPIPQSLREALLAFVLVCAARRERGQAQEHNSMLVHLSRLQDVQSEVFHLIEAEVKSIRLAIRNSTPRDPRPVMAELKDLWESDFLETTLTFDDPTVRAIPWTTLQDHLVPAVEKITVKVINGRSEDALNYYNNRNQGVSVIAIGGAKLSRGLTLEGLSISYFQRTTKMYDTLMQMGRWFGYRRGYTDLCRLYTSDELIGWYRDIAMATEELYNQFEEMRIIGATPKQFGLKVAKSPQNLLITARVKMRNATRVKLSYAGENPSYRALKAESVPRYVETTSKLIRWAQSQKEPTDSAKPNYLFEDLPAAGVLAFLDEFPEHPGITSADPRLLAEFIRACNAVDELTRWSIALISVTAPRARIENIAGFNVKLVKRRSEDPSKANEQVIGTLWDPAHEALGLSLDEITAAKAFARQFPDGTAEPLRGKAWRKGRSPKHGLLVIYPLDPAGFDPDNGSEIPSGFTRFSFIPTFGISFPDSDRAPAIDYLVRNDYWTNADEDDEGVL